MNDCPDWLSAPVSLLDEASATRARNRQNSLTKPPGALGRLENLAIRLAAMQGTTKPRLERVHITVFAADHGVAIEGVSAFPQTVTGDMVRNFARGGGAINVLARVLGATLEIIDLGTIEDKGPLPGVVKRHLGPGTANFCHSPAMTEGQLAEALDIGRQVVTRIYAAGAQLFIGGEMGIGNTTAATALACALLDAAPERLAGPGSGLDSAGISHKIAVIRRALTLHQTHLANPLEALRRLGGFEITALTGAFIAGAQRGIPLLIDGFIASVAALAAVRLCPRADDWFLFAHRSGEPGHGRVLEALAGQPLLDLGMRLGEGSGAATAVPLLRLAYALHNEMATFTEAGVAKLSHRDP